MKGIAHFSIGVAVASCFPSVVRAGADGNPLGFLLGGIFGLLPDTIDFKFTRYFYRHDLEVVPDPLRPNARMTADAVALAINRAYETGRAVRIKLAPVRLAADAWRRYEVEFDVPARKVNVRFGPAVDTSGNELSERWGGAATEAEAALTAPIKIEYFARLTIDAFDGPVLTMEPQSDGRIAVKFIPWHRTWSHSLITSFLAGLATTWWLGPIYGAVVGGAHAAHVLTDQIGYLGSSLFYPFQRERVSGWRLAASSGAAVNLVAVWSASLLIFWNLCRNMNPAPAGWTGARLALYGLMIPALLLAALTRRRLRAHRRRVADGR